MRRRVLIASNFSKRVSRFAQENSISLVEYSFPNIDFDNLLPFEELIKNLKLERVN
jgi:hypothetical protein